MGHWDTANSPAPLPRTIRLRWDLWHGAQWSCRHLTDIHCPCMGQAARAGVHSCWIQHNVFDLRLSDDFDASRVRIFNQVAEVFSVRGLAQILADQYGAEVNFLDNPRKELADNELEVSNTGLVSLGFEPITLNEGLVEDVKFIADATKENFKIENVMTSPKW